ncbi:hypothetical protein Clacol_009345 [Clathrus columnatus]|uniref:BED-type domain-containing protein n=1 Tax=Clathrus columnatus TaxID=1419009 RepID=A0AAV5AT35_9AGAM|nr:hypothetical protein Clacol_009345 [Clathrus columnatus]
MRHIHIHNNNGYPQVPPIVLPAPQPTTMYPSDPEELMQAWNQFCVPYPPANFNPHFTNSQAVPQGVPNHSMNQWQHHAPTGGPVSQVPSGYPAGQHDIGHSSLPVYGTQGGLDASNPSNPLQMNHTGFGTPTHDVPQNFVMQQSQGSGSLPTPGTNQVVSGTASGSSSFGPSTPYTHHAAPSTVTNPTPYWLPNGPPFPPYTPTPLPQPQPLLRTRTPSKKRTHKPAKAPLTPTVTLGPKNGTLRKVLKSTAWIDTYFKNRKVCKLCGGGCTEGRVDRLLEHLVSVHFVQVIKNRGEYDVDHFAEQADLQPHFIATQTAFDYTRRFVDTVRCSLCSEDTSLVFRKPSIWNHLKRSHAKTTMAIRQEEADRLGALEPDEKDFYNIHDKFLYHFPGGINSEIGG